MRNWSKTCRTCSNLFLFPLSSSSSSSPLFCDCRQLFVWAKKRKKRRRTQSESNLRCPLSVQSTLKPRYSVTLRVYGLELNFTPFRTIDAVRWGTVCDSVFKVEQRLQMGATKRRRYDQKNTREKGRDNGRNLIRKQIIIETKPL